MIDIDKFVVEYIKTHKNIKDNITVINGLKNILNNINNTPSINTKIPYQAYILATIYWETDQKMYPSKEVRQVKTDTPRRKEVRRLQDRYWSTGFYGRGYCHLTWKDNYKKMSGVLIAFGGDKYKNRKPDFLVTDPDLALDEEISFDIIVLGMLRGCFNGSGHGLGYYLDKIPPDYLGARRTVNGTDKAREIDSIAQDFHKILLKTRK